jgi:hypothetical protein
MLVEKQMYSGWNKTVHIVPVGCKGPGREVGFLAGKKHDAHETAIYFNLPIHSFTGDRRKLTSLIGQQLSMLRFYENVRRSSFFLVDKTF